ncbi:MAG: DNA alkylation repair protein, partial [Tissierellia bacterium]|nr:DNA alkylation repair protein [Tissierellia bacterium]
FIENENYLEKVYTIIDDIKSSDYYVKMAIAWAVSMGYKYHKDKTLIYLENCKLDDFTYNKAIQKIIELKGTNKDEKMYLRNIKR